MAKKKITDLIMRAYDLGSRKGYEIASRTIVNESTGKDEFRNIVLETALNSLETSEFKSISAELDSMNEQFPEFNCWRIFSDGVMQGVDKNFSKRTANRK